MLINLFGTKFSGFITLLTWHHFNHMPIVIECLSIFHYLRMNLKIQMMRDQNHPQNGEEQVMG